MKPLFTLRSLPLLFLWMSCSIPAFLFAQGTNLPVNDDNHILIDRYQIRSGRLSGDIFSTIKPYNRKYIAAFLHQLDSMDMSLSRVDSFNLQYLKADNPEWYEGPAGQSKKPILKHIYRDKAVFYGYKKGNSVVYINPILGLFAGNEFSPSSSLLGHNTRGVVVRGHIAKKLGFYSSLIENQVKYPQYFDAFVDSNVVFPGAGFLKPFKSDGYDFNIATGYFTFSPIKAVDLQFGHDKNFIGNGFRSILLSGFSREALFLKVNTRIGKISYVNIFSEYTDAFSEFSGSENFGRKYAAAHMLNVNITKNLNIGLMETVVFHRGDSLSKGSYDLNYLNPIILYRSIEGANSAHDNMLVGLNFNAIIAKHLQLNGQLILDEFVFGRLLSNSGWWANKFGYQLGGKYIDALGIRNLDLQAEYNFVRPYTYSHREASQSYAHYNVPLAHPYGANFTEILGVIRYQPLPRFTTTLTAFMITTGVDTSGSNWGSNILLSYTSREQDEGNVTGQGVRSTVTFAEWKNAYQLRHNIWLELRLFYRDSEGPSAFTNTGIIAGLKYNFNNFHSYF